ncbi:MAG: hypothetical protein ACREF4_11730, partial [Gammaproteobacteria bacterium]
FVDRALGRYDVAAALTAAGMLVEVHDSHFAQDVDDHVWLDLCAARGWIALTKDDRIRYDELAKGVLLRSSIAVFTLKDQHMLGAAMGALFATMRPKMERVYRKIGTGFIAYITRSGKIGRILGPEDLK